MVEDTLPRSILLIVFIIVGGFFSGCETAFSYCNTVRMKVLSEDGDKRAKRVVFLTDKFDKTVVTLLVAVNIIHVVSASVATVLCISIMGQSGSIVATVGMTLLTFIFSETIPKNIAKANSDAFSLMASGVVMAFYHIFTPVTLFLSGIGEAVKKIFHIVDDAPSVTEDEFSTMVEDIQNEGLIEESEKDIIQSSMKFHDITVDTVMTKAESIIAIDEGYDIERIKNFLLEHSFSRYPVLNKEHTKVVGILLSNKFLYEYMDEEEIELEDFMDEPLIFSKDIKASDALQVMRKEQSHMAVLLDDDDKIAGLVTMDDILEKLVGEIEDESIVRLKKPIDNKNRTYKAGYKSASRPKSKVVVKSTKGVGQ